MQSSNPALPAVSVVCVFNDEAVLRNCLQRSIDAQDTVDVDFIPVDNRSHDFKSAGAALNFGIERCRHELVVLAHQDVYVHSFERIIAAGQQLGEHSWKLLGANGMTSSGQSVGLLRDRVKLVGVTAPTPQDVDSLDEVLIVARREHLQSEPLSEDQHVAWHAYAVEYGLRLRAKGYRVGAVDLGITHNSMTVNLKDLDVAHQWVGETYPAFQPIHTTCGTIGAVQNKFRELPLVRNHRWRTTWLKQSAQAFRAQRFMRTAAVLADISHDVDLLDFSAQSPLHVFNMDYTGGFIPFASGAIELLRNQRPVVMQAASNISDLARLVADMDPESRILVTDIAMRDLAAAQELGPVRWLAGVQPGAVWLLAGPDLDALPHSWYTSKAVPLGIKKL